MKTTGFAVLVILLSLLLAAFPVTGSYIFYMPVIVKSSSSPEVLMPGDSAILTIVMENGAAQYGAGGENARDQTLSTPVNATWLIGTEEIEVLSSDYSDIGMIGPNDNVVLYYKIRANDSLPDGTYFLDFNVVAGYDLFQIGRKIPIKVDSSGVSLARAELPGEGSISLDVANPRDNSLSAVSIIPSAVGVVFSPEEYYIGSMDPDEVFTISFALSSENPANELKGPINLSFSSKFKNGENWHQSESYITTYNPLPEDSGGIPLNLLGGGALVLVLVGGYLYWKKKLPFKRS
jgi:hypothetical protein